MDTPWSVGIDIERTTNRYIAKDYDIKAYGGALHASYPLNPFTRFGWHYRVRNTYVNVQGQESNTYLQNAAKINGLISASGVSLNFDSTDCPGCPTNASDRAWSWNIQDLVEITIFGDLPT